MHGDKMKSRHIATMLLIAVLAGCAGRQTETPSDKEKPGHPGGYGQSSSSAELLPDEARHLSGLRRLTSGGADAEAYFSPDSKALVFQSTRDGHELDQIYTIGLDGSAMRRVSPGPGRTTCAFYFPDGETLVYATTHFAPEAECRIADMKKGERWVFDPAFDIVSCRLDGSGLTRLTDEPGYDAECAVSRATGRIVFCSTRTGDPEIFVMNRDGTGVKQLTSRKGYDGGPFFSPDGARIVWRTYCPPTPEAEAEYDAFIARDVCGRWPFDIWIMNADGSDQRRVTDRGEKTGATCWAPYLHPDNRNVVFVSTSTPPGRGMPNFDLYTIGVDGTGLTRITFSPAFDAFPMFSDDGKKVSFVSSRGGTSRGEVSIFVADWVP